MPQRAEQCFSLIATEQRPDVEAVLRPSICAKRAVVRQQVKAARRRGEDIGADQVLSRYQRWRRFDTASLALATDTFTRLFSNNDRLLRGLRDLGMGAVDATPALRRAFIREAAGLTGDLPALMAH